MDICKEDLKKKVIEWYEEYISKGDFTGFSCHALHEFLNKNGFGNKYSYTISSSVLRTSPRHFEYSGDSSFPFSNTDDVASSEHTQRLRAHFCKWALKHLKSGKFDIRINECFATLILNKKLQGINMSNAKTYIVSVTTTIDGYDVHTTQMYTSECRRKGAIELLVSNAYDETEAVYDYYDYTATEDDGNIVTQVHIESIKEITSGEEAILSKYL